MYHKRHNELAILSLYLMGYTKRFYLREISKFTELPLKTTQRTLENLEKAKILKSEIHGKNKYFSLNLNNINTKSYLLQAEIYKTDLFLETYPQIKTFLKSLKTNVPLIVFGSFARLKADKTSDLDLLIVSEKKQKLTYHLLPQHVHEVCLSEMSFRKAFKEQETLIKEIEENHIILNNHSFYINAMWEHYAG